MIGGTAWLPADEVRRVRSGRNGSIGAITGSNCGGRSRDHRIVSRVLTGGKGPFRAIWSIDGHVDSTDSQRTISVPRNSTRVELLVTLTGIGQTFRVQVFNARGDVGTYSFTNSAGNVACNPTGESPVSNVGRTHMDDPTLKDASIKLTQAKMASK